VKHILSDIQLVSNSGKGRQIVLLEKIKELTSSKKVIYILMTLLVFLWGLEFIAAKAALDAIKPLSLVCFKYSTGLIFLIITKTIADRRLPLKPRDIPLLLICALFGEVLYFAGEYGAMAYLPVSVITILLAFVPCLSVLIELILYKNKPSGLVVAGVLVSVIGVSMVIGADFQEFFQGKYLGYILAFSAVISWNVYNYLTKGLSKKYKPLDLTILQQICAILLVLPYTVFNLPDINVIDSQVVMGVLYLGVVSSFIGFLIYVKAIVVIGPTPCALYSNFLPVTTTFFGWVILHEYVSFMQILGGVVVIASGAVVIWQKGKEDGEHDVQTNLSVKNDGEGN
jgi:drug/metabolite transporter (DMT)-like permease